MALTASEIAELNRLGTNELRMLHESMQQDIQDLHVKWSLLSAEQNPDNDEEILTIFKLLDLREDTLPEIENILAARSAPNRRAA